MIQYILIRVYVLQRLKVLGNFTCSPLVTPVWQSSVLVQYYKKCSAFHHHPLMLSLKDIKIPVQTFLVKIGIQYIISLSNYYLPRLAWSDMVWEGVYTVFLHTTYIDLGIFDPIFPWKYPFKCKLHCKVFRIGSWKISQFWAAEVSDSIAALWAQKFMVTISMVPWCLLPLTAKQTKDWKLSLKNSQFCILNKKPWASAGRVIDSLLGENFHPIKCPPGLILWVWIRGLEIQILPCKWIICHWPSITLLLLVSLIWVLLICNVRFQ